MQIATVCNFFMFLRHIQQGLIKTTSEFDACSESLIHYIALLTAKTIYTELCKLRASMHMTRLGIEVKNSRKQN